MIDRRHILRFRAHQQQLDRAAGAGTLADTAVLDVGVQDSGPDGGRWALAIRGLEADPKDLVLLWTVRGAPHLYRRADVGKVAAAVEPYSEADAGKRMVGADKPLKAAGIGSVQALDEVAAQMREIVAKPAGKGAVSERLSGVLPAPYLRYCRTCDATHPYEQPFRLAAIRAGLELQQDTSPPVLKRIPRFRKAAASGDRFDLVRGYLRLLGPATPKEVALYLDAPVRDVRAQWPEDAVEVYAAEEKRYVLAEDKHLVGHADAPGTRLLGPFDLFLQGRDRYLVVPDPGLARQLWPVLGRPGAVLLDGELAGTWRPRSAARGLTVAMAPWQRLSGKKRAGITEQAERLAAHRGVPLAGVTFD